MHASPERPQNPWASAAALPYFQIVSVRCSLERGAYPTPFQTCIKYRFSLLMPNDVEHVLLRLQQIDPLCSELFIYGHCVGEMKVSKQNKSSVIQVLRHQLPSSSALEGRGFHRCIHDVDNDLRRFDEIVRRQFRRISSRTSCSRKKRQ